MSVARGLPFHLVDVFTEVGLSGNPLGLVPAADDLDEETMRAVARELNQSETTFLLRPPPGSGADWRLRSFTATGVEVFGAGHNSLGAWWWLAATGHLALDGERSMFHQLIGELTLPVEIIASPGQPIVVGLRQAPPRFGSVHDDAASLASALGLGTEDLDVGIPTQTVFTGASHLMVPVRDRAALARCRPDPTGLTALLEAVGAQGCYVFALGTDMASEPTAWCRFFNPAVGLSEDPGTGSAAGPLACHLKGRGIIDGEVLIVHQGVEMHRPCRIEVRLDATGARVFGSAVASIEGTLRVAGDASPVTGPAAEIDHFVLEVSDPVAVAHDLSELLELTVDRLDEFRSGDAPFPSLRVTDGLVIDLFPRRLWSGTATSNPNHLCFSLSRAHFDRVVARLNERSIAITRTDPHNFGARGWGSSVYFDGPDRLSIEIRHYPAGRSFDEPQLG